MTNRYIFLLLFLFAIVFAHGQAPVADFTADQTEHCNSGIVTFNDHSSASPNSWLWDFGDGSSRSIEENPTHSYTSPGIYTVSLKATNANGSDSISKTDYIIIRVGPSAKYTVTEDRVCLNSPADFIDASTKGDVMIVGWIWNYGDGAMDSIQNSSYVYASTGSYNVILTVIDANGCTDNEEKSNAITIIDGPTASFTASSLAACTPPLEINFTNTSIPNGLTYSWDFGDNTTSTEKSPTKTYTNVGVFDVSLVVSNSSCSDTIRLSDNDTIINLSVINADFSMDVSSGCSPLSVNLTDKSSSGVVSWNWDFGNGTTSSTQSPVAIFADTGIFTISLNIEDSRGCTDEATATVNVIDDGSNIDFNCNETLSCDTPFTAIFTSSTPADVIEWNWNFGDGFGFSNEENPTYKYKEAGNYDVSLTTKNQSGCTNNIVKSSYIKIVNMKADFEADVQEGCKTLPVKFSNLSYSDTSINKYHWTFWDGQVNILRDPDPISFSDTGKYDIRLIIEDDFGCIDTMTKEKYILVGIPPTANFSASPLIGCHKLDVDFVSLSDNFADEWLWNLGNGAAKGDTVFTTYKDTGYFDISLICSHNGCDGEEKTVDSMIYVQPPKPAALVDNEGVLCDSLQDISFANLSQGADTTWWNFGDSTALLVSTTENTVLHEYKNSGKFSVSIYTLNNLSGCRDTIIYEDMVSVSRISPDFSVNKTEICQYKALQFTDETVSLFDLGAWTWHFGNGDSSNSQNPSFSYDSAGTYDVRIESTDELGCMKYLTKNQIIETFELPSPRFSATSAILGCAPLAVSFTESSTAVAPSTLNAWKWSFGDGNNGVGTSVSNNYTSRGDYPVSLTVTDTKGCDSTLTKTNYVFVAKPEALFSVNSNYDSIICFYDTTLFTNNSNSNAGSLAYIWNFGDLIEDTINASPKHFYQQDTTSIYDVSLIAEDTMGCLDSINKNIIISRPVVRFSVNEDSVDCPPHNAIFSISTYDSISSWKWNFGDTISGSSNTTVIKEPIHQYKYANNYNVILSYINEYQCADTINKLNYIFVDGPSGSFSFSPKSGCAPLEVVFIANSSNTAKYKWNFSSSQSITDSLTHDTTKHTYPINTSISYYLPELILFDSIKYPGDDVCPVSIVSKDTLEIVSVLAAFTNMDSACVFTEMTFANQSEASHNDSLKYLWDYQDNFYDSIANPSHTYDTSANFTVSLTASITTTIDTTIYSCVDTAYKTLTVNARPDVDFTTEQNDNDYYNNSLNCFDKSAGTGLSWEWDLGDGNVSNSQNPTHTYSEVGTYTIKLTVTTSDGCIDEKSLDVDVGENMIPNAFTPDGDLINDVFPQDLNVSSLTIFSQWGTALYKGDKAWDGKYNNEIVLPGTYYYVLVLIDINGEEQKFTGPVTVVKK